MKKVAILLTSEPESGGEHQYLMLLIESLVKCNGKYFSLLAISCNSFWNIWCREHGVAYVRSNVESYSCKYMRANAMFPFFFQLYNIRKTEWGKIIKKYGINLLIGGQQSIFIPQYKCKIIQPVHDLMHRYEPNFQEIQSSYGRRESLFSSEARFVDVVLVDSKLGQAQYLECYYNKRRHNPKVEILPFVALVDTKTTRDVETPTKYLFYPAQFWMHKNHINLIKAINLLKETIPDIHLVLVGSERNSLQIIKDMIQNLSLSRNVSILGFVSDEQVKYLYKNAVALVMPSYFGPTNIPPLEAMALGCPVIVSNNYAMCEQVGEAGLLCNPDSPEDIARCILQVWTNEELRENMIARGYEQCKKWTRKEFKKKFLKIVLRELYGKKPE